MRIKRRKKLASGVRVKPPCASRVNERWTMDFVSDALADGCRIRVLTLIDSFTRECLAIRVAHSLPAQAVTDALDEVIATRGQPETIQVDNGSEFTSNHFDAWAYLRGIDLDFIRPGKPVENAFIESFNGRTTSPALAGVVTSASPEAYAGKLRAQGMLSPRNRSIHTQRRWRKT